MRLFKSDLVDRVMTALKIPDDVPIENKSVTNAIASAQSQVEAQNFDSRKNVLKYDDVMNRQREVIYGERRAVLEGADLREQVTEMFNEVVTSYVTEATQGFPEEWDLEGLWAALKQLYPISLDVNALEEEAGGREGIDRDELIEQIQQDVARAYEAREAETGSEIMRELERRDRALRARPQVARAPLRDGLPPRGHRPACVLSARPAGGVPARGLRDVQDHDGRDPGGVGRLPVQPRRHHREEEPEGPDEAALLFAGPQGGAEGGAEDGDRAAGPLLVAPGPGRPSPSAAADLLRSRARPARPRSPRASRRATPTTRTPPWAATSCAPVDRARSSSAATGRPGGPTGLIAERR